MATRFVQRGSPVAASQTGEHAGIGVKASDNLLYVNADGTARPIPTANVEAKTASFTATAAQSGTTFVADSTTSVIVTLPATAKGLRYTLVVGQLTTVTGHSFSPAAADKIMGNGFTAADDKDAICTAASDRIGDAITLVGDGVDGWYITSVVGTWARE